MKFSVVKRKSSIIGVVLILILVILILVNFKQEKIEAGCENDGDCYRSCYGCINKNSIVLIEKCNIPSLPCKCIRNYCQYQLSEPGEEIEVYLATNCTPNDSCWKINLLMNETEIEIRMNTSSGEVMEEYCNEDECEIVGCIPSFHEITPEGDVWYYNMGCENPKPTCDIDAEICRGCTNNIDCLRKIKRIVISLDVQQIFTNYEYRIIGSNVEGQYDDVKKKCTVSNTLYPNVTAEECEQIVLAFAKCVNGKCKAG